MKDRGSSRHHAERIKAKVRRRLREAWHLGDLAQDPRYVGKQAAVHMRGCSCMMCKAGPGKPEATSDDEE